MLEKENDISAASTKANSAIVHAGYDPSPNTKMAKYNVEGNALIEKLCADLDVLYKKVGSFVVAFNDEDREAINKLLEKGKANGVKGLKIIEKDEIFALEPNLNKEVICALYAPSAGIIAPWELAIAQAECAVNSGAKVHLNTNVKNIKREKDYFIVQTEKGDFKSRFVINAAGVNSDIISAMVETPHFSIQPKSGEYYLLDTTEKGIVSRVIFPCPSALGKGTLVSPTIHENIIVGPDSKDIDDRDNTECTAIGLDNVRKTALRLVPSINLKASIRNFAGIRADAGIEDFIVGESKEVSGFINVAAIKSPGLTSAPAIAKDVASMLKEKDLDFSPNPNFVEKRKVTRFKYLNANEKKEIIKKNPLYGTIVCRCQTITEGEIVEAMRRPISPLSVDAVKRRCGTGMGRCQGGFCGPRVQAIIAREAKIKQSDVPLDKQDMYIVSGRTKNEQG
jgi:glycerol-3-phosphate dehydrogenase